MRKLVLLVLTGLLALVAAPTRPPPPAQSLRAADPSVLRVGGTYVAVQSTGGGIAVRQASSTAALAAARRPAGLVGHRGPRRGLGPGDRAATAAATTSTSRPAAARPTGCT